jgi:UDPglucose--hexose-1-phosphate uridylyltransferase
MAGGLFELRKDPITGWWVAVVVDREFERQRFQVAARPVSPPGDACQNCEHPSGDGVRVRVLKPQAFSVAGTEREARESGHDDRAPGLGLVGDCGSWQTIVAPVGHHGSLAEERPAIVVEMLARARDAVAAARDAGETDYLQVVQNWGAQAGARTDHLCLDFYDLPQIPHRIGEELGGAARYLIREGVCPYCRLVRDELADRVRVVWEDAASVCFAPYASRSPFELWVVPRHHDADFGRATDEQIASATETLQKVMAMLSVLDGPPYNLVLHTAPLRERVDETYHWHWEIHPRLREIAGLELGTGLPVNPVSPEEAVEELLAASRRSTSLTDPSPGAASLSDPTRTSDGSIEVPVGGRGWDEFPREGTR